MEIKTNSIERLVKGLLPSSFKNLVSWLLANSTLGKFLKVTKMRWNFFGGFFDYSLVSDKEAARIFWGLWESAEIRFSKRFATSDTIVELGSSVGVTLGVLSNHRKNTKFVCVEASSENYEKLQILQRQLPERGNDYLLVNKAIAYGVDSVRFCHQSTTGSKIDTQSVAPGDSKYHVEATTLQNLLNEHAVTEAYTLITDIEGAEESIFFQDPEALDHCNCVIAELEDTSSHTAEEQISKLKSLGFDLIERYHNVVVMSRI